MTGLGGHAYGSWRDRTSKSMWLHDLLPEDLEDRARIMIFGYNTALQGKSISTAGFLDFSRDLLDHVENARCTVTSPCFK